MKLGAEFYGRGDVVTISRELIGKVLCTRIDGVLTSAIICETEAYAGVEDRASHAFGGRRTKRTHRKDPDHEHRDDFCDAIRNRRRPNADIEEGHRSTTMSLLSKISLAVGQRIEWDPQTEQITNSPAANDLLHYEYRAPWKLL